MSLIRSMIAGSQKSMIYFKNKAGLGHGGMLECVFFGSEFFSYLTGYHMEMGAALVALWPFFSTHFNRSLAIQFN